MPCPYAQQLEALARLDLGDDWLRAVVHDNGARLLGLSAEDVGDVRGNRR
jgi:predicted TIM-barrel fold metal-dependent hydrolase